jgi:hypothetical protein
MFGPLSFLTDPEENEVKDSMFNPAFANLIEMSYWFVKFEGDYQSLYDIASEKSTITSKMDGDRQDVKNKRWFSKDTGRLIKFARYFLKYVGSYQKLLESVKRISSNFL